MAIKTHRQKWSEYNRKQHKCITCGKNANYWSQDETPDGQKQGHIFWHCQLHRNIARLYCEIVENLNDMKRYLISY